MQNFTIALAVGKWGACSCRMLPRALLVEEPFQIGDYLSGRLVIKPSAVSAGLLGWEGVRGADHRTAGYRIDRNARRQIGAIGVLATWRAGKPLPIGSIDELWQRAIVEHGRASVVVQFVTLDLRAERTQVFQQSALSDFAVYRLDQRNASGGDQCDGQRHDQGIYQAEFPLAASQSA